MIVVNIISVVLIAIGCAFFVAGSIGMLRLPDVYTRLHASTKADNVGLGLLTIGLILQSNGIWFAAKLVLIWLLVVMAGAAACHLIAQLALRWGMQPWSKP